MPTSPQTSSGVQSRALRHVVGTALPIICQKSLQRVVEHITDKSLCAIQDIPLHQRPQTFSTPALLIVTIWQMMQEHGCMDCKIQEQFLLSVHLHVSYCSLLASHQQLTANPKRPSLPSLLLANMCSLENKAVYLKLKHTKERDMKDCCAFIFTETCIMAFQGRSWPPALKSPWTETA